MRRSLAKAVVHGLVLLPCGCVCDSRRRTLKRLLRGSRFECIWCGATTHWREFLAWLGADPVGSWLTLLARMRRSPPVLVRFGAQVLQAAGSCGDCGSLLARSVSGADVVFHMSTEAALDTVRLWD